MNYFRHRQNNIIHIQISRNHVSGWIPVVLCIKCEQPPSNVQAYFHRAVWVLTPQAACPSLITHCGQAPHLSSARTTFLPPAFATLLCWVTVTVWIKDESWLSSMLLIPHVAQVSFSFFHLLCGLSLNFWSSNEARWPISTRGDGKKRRAFWG